MSRQGIQAPTNALEDVQRRTGPTEMLREFPRSMPVSDAVALAATETIAEWSEVTEQPTLSEGVELSKLDNLFRLLAPGSIRPLPTTAFRFRSYGVPVLYGHTILIQRENPALPVRDERSDGLSEPRTEQGGRESRKLR